MEVKSDCKQTDLEDWQLKKFGEVAVPRRERIDPRRTGVHDFCIELEHIESGSGQILGSTSTGTQSSLKSVFHPGDVLFGKLRAYLRKYWRATRQGVCSTEIWVLVPRGDTATSEFLFQIVQTDDFIDATSNSYGTHMPRSDWNAVQNHELKMPPLPEQRAIAEALSDVDGLMGGLERLIAKKRDLKQAAMQQLLTGQSRLPGFHGEWEVKRLGELAEMGSGGTPTTSVPAYYDGEIPWVSISDMTKGGKVIATTERNLTRAGFTSCAAQMFPAGTVLYAMYASLGECSIAGIPLCSSQAILGIRTRTTLSNEFLYYYLTSLKPIVKSLGQQGTQANLNKGMVQKFRLRLPSPSEQTAIAEVLTEMDAELAALEQRREKTHALKQAIMQELLTGRTRLV